MGLSAPVRRATPIAAEALGGEHAAMLKNPVMVCLALAAIVVVAVVAEAVVVLSSRRRRIAW